MKERLPRITIVTPSFNQGAYLEETICSVLEQNYPNLQYIIIDGGSTDNSLSIIQQYASHLDYWVSEPDGGQADAINKGLAISDGEIMGWLNSDDLLLPNALHHIGRHFATHPATNIVCGFRRFSIGQLRTRGRGVHLQPDQFSLQRHCYIAQETTYWRRSVWETVGTLNQELDFAIDYELWLRMLEAGYQFELLPYYLGLFRLHEESKTVSKLDSVGQKEIKYLRHKYLGTNRDASDWYDDISWRWRFNSSLIHYAAHARLLSEPTLAKLIINLLTPSKSQKLV